MHKKSVVIWTYSDGFCLRMARDFDLYITRHPASLRESNVLISWNSGAEIPNLWIIPCYFTKTLQKNMKNTIWTFYWVWNEQVFVCARVRFAWQPLLFDWAREYRWPFSAAQMRLKSETSPNLAKASDQTLYLCALESFQVLTRCRIVPTITGCLTDRNERETKG